MHLQTHILFTYIKILGYLIFNKFKTFLTYRLKVFKQKITHPWIGMLKVFWRGLKLVEYCKKCKSFIADSKIIKKS